MIGILALQGDVREHVGAFGELGVDTCEVRRREDLSGLDGIVLPGGESTTLSLLLASAGLFDPLTEELGAGMPVLGTCAGLVLLASRIVDGRPDQRTFGLIDCTVQRNGYGRQRFSFRTMLEPVPGSSLPATPDVDGVVWPGGAALPAVFIRAPRVVSVGPDVGVLARLASGGRPDHRASDPVLCRQGNALASSFHPELTPDRRVHRLFAEMAGVLKETSG
ncbi:MAG: pyridoxal 5'-phosphate synthase glutaminase subunit PdxT [Acidimicrobiales bacterium]